MTSRDVYIDRNRAVQLAVKLAQMLGYEAGIRQPVEDGKNPVVCIKLPTGEVAWHINSNDLVTEKLYYEKYDGHTNEDKASRILEFIKYN